MARIPLTRRPPRRRSQGEAGNAVQYLTRNQALKKLQLKLSAFRRLCILKGVHPREPKRKAHGQHKTYYHAKDIAYLLHEPLLKKARRANPPAGPLRTCLRAPLP
jgi:pescadillo protein